MKLCCPFFARERYGRRGGEDGGRDSADWRGSRLSGIRGAHGARVVRTRKAIRQAFLTLMQETEYQKITITGIAREADIDRKTFYLHYQSVEDLANEIVQDEADRIVRTCLDSLENSDDGENVVDLFKRLSLGLAPDLKSMKLIASHTPYELVLKKLESYCVAYRAGHAWPEEVGAVSRFLRRVFQCGARGGDSPLDLRRVGDSPRGYRPGDARARP